MGNPLRSLFVLAESHLDRCRFRRGHQSRLLSVSGSVGAVKLFAVAKTTNARFVGDDGADEFAISELGLSAISFEVNRRLPQ